VLPFTALPLVLTQPPWSPPPYPCKSRNLLSWLLTNLPHCLCVHGLICLMMQPCSKTLRPSQLRPRRAPHMSQQTIATYSLQTDQSAYPAWPVQPTCMSLSGSAHSRSHSSPLSGTSVGRATRLMSSRFLRSGDRPPCMHRICEATHGTTSAGQHSQEATRTHEVTRTHH
jgi:hypothetical protein